MQIRYLVLLVVLLLAGFFVYNKFRAGQDQNGFGTDKEVVFESSAPQASNAAGIKVNFSQNGNLVKKDGQWALVYDTPGNPATEAKLVFITGSVCDFEKGGVCDQALFVQGQRVRVDGDNQNGTVTVAGMAKVAE